MITIKEAVSVAKIVKLFMVSDCYRRRHCFVFVGAGESDSGDTDRSLKFVFETLSRTSECSVRVCR